MSPTRIVDGMPVIQAESLKLKIARSVNVELSDHRSFPMELAPGLKLGPYEILSPIGAGGMGEVFKARDTRLDRIVAVKVMPKHIAAREDLRARFEREARTVSSLNHPNICVLHEIGKQDGIDFMVLEYLEGETLAARIARGRLPIDQALKYAMQIADALDRSHRKGVVHRDVKPANIMITREGLKVLDFGLAKSAVSKARVDDATMTIALTEEGAVVGTPQYMAPELYNGVVCLDRAAGDCRCRNQRGGCRPVPAASVAHRQPEDRPCDRRLARIENSHRVGARSCGYATHGRTSRRSENPRLPGTDRS